MATDSHALNKASKSASAAAPTTHGHAERAGVTSYFAGYFWFILKNVVGWTFILGSPVLGLAVPGPGGIPVFLIGFALVTFPGKRKLTSRVMRGRGLPIEAEIFTFITAAVAIVTTSILMALVSANYDRVLSWFGMDPRGLARFGLDPRVENPPIAAIVASLLGIGIIALGVTWVVMRLSLKVLNYVLRTAPMIRRKIRPWLRRQGINLLPSRRKRTEGDAPPVMRDADEILQLHERHHHRLRTVWATLGPWAKRAIAVGITLAIFVWILRPIFKQWHDVRAHVRDISVLRVVAASGMFAIFLFVFRVLAWRRILQGLGCNIPVAAASRIWITSELARYLPGAIWQVIGRIYLAKPYGVRGTITSVSQILELSIFLLANILVAVACMLYFGIKHLDGAAKAWLYVAMCVAPVLLVLLHPRVFYGIINRVVRKLGKPEVESRIGGVELLGLLGWNIFGLLWQSLALYVVLQPALGLKLDWWWVVAGAYCLAWTAGFLAVWAPGGIGVRELVFVTAMRVALPHEVQRQFEDRQVLLGFLALLSVLLRLWATLGEIILAVIAYALDFRGALNLPSAPGRVPMRRGLTDLDSAA
jgi:hypothetical protein